MLLKIFCTFYLVTRLSYSQVLYDSFSGTIATDDLIAYYEANSATERCIAAIKPCDAEERKRVDGSCNNLNNPSRGTYYSKLYRILPANFHNGSDARKAVSGKDLPNPRVVRYTMLKEGKSVHPNFNHAVPGFGIYTFNDFGTAHDTENLIGNVNYCCQAERMNAHECTPIVIAEDDPVHRFSHIRCLNNTRPLTFQDYRCTNQSEPSMLSIGTPSYDLSNIYNAHNKGDSVLRSYVGGQMLTEEEDGKSWPPNGPTASCPLNQEGETRCFENYFNTVVPISLFTVWFLRNHNYIASQLAAINPCWDDDTLFFVARDINMAYAQQMYVYEWLTALQGRKNLIKYGIIPKNDEYIDIYDEKAYPAVALEYTFALRWFHIFQETILKMFDSNGVHVKDYPMLNLTFRVGYLAKDNNMEYATQSMFRQPCHNPDSVDPGMAEYGLPGLQEAFDILSGDVNKNRYFGLRAYIDYLSIFTKRNFTCFEDLRDFIPKDKIALLKWVYDDVKDIDLIAGMWVEKHMKGGKIPYSLACILNENILNIIRSDRHWYRRPNRPHRFTKAQLREMNKATFALCLCNVGDGVTNVQKQAFLNISPTNPIVSCSEIPQMNFTAWADPTCQKCDE